MKMNFHLIPSRILRLCLCGIITVTILACSIPGIGTPASEVQELLPATGPDVVILEPYGSAYIHQGGAIAIMTVARGDVGVTRLDLWVDDMLVLTQDSPDPAGITPLILNSSLLATQPGEYSLVARAYDSQGGIGESLAVTVTVTEEPLDPPDIKPALYIVSPDETLDEISQKTGNDLTALQNANPGLSDPVVNGQIVALPSIQQDFLPVEPAVNNAAALVPALSLSQLGANNPPSLPPGDGFVLGEGQPAVLLLNADPNANPPAAPQGDLKAPEISKLSHDPTAPSGCWVNVKWKDQSNNETGFVIYRRSKPDQPFASPVGSTLADYVGYTDKSVPSQGSYEYIVEAEQKTGSTRIVARSAPVDVVVTLTESCKNINNFKRIYFQPLSFTPLNADISQVALWYSINNSAARRIPATLDYWYPGVIHKAPPESLPLPASAWLNPDQAFVVKIWSAGYTQEAWSRGTEGPTDLGTGYNSHTLTEIPDMKSGNFFTIRAAGFSIDYRLWTEDVKWTGEGGTTDTIAAPTNLRVTSTSVTSRTLAWDWNGNSNTIEGFILYRSFTCPGGEKPNIAPMVIPAQSKTIELRFKSEPGGCSYAYWVSAYGRAGESAPSNTIFGDTETASSSVKIIFKDLIIGNMNGLPGGGFISFFANQVRIESDDMLYLQAGTRSMQDIIFDARKPNNGLTMNLSQNEFLTLGFSVSRIDDTGRAIPDGVCRGVAVFPPVDKWKQPAQSYILRAPNGGCEMTVEINSQEAIKVGGAYVTPTADLAITEVAYMGTGVYAYVVNNGPDDLPNNSYWLGGNIYQGGQRFADMGLTTCNLSLITRNGYIPPRDYWVQSNLPQWIELYDTTSYGGMHLCQGKTHYCGDCPMILDFTIVNPQAGENGHFIDPNLANNETIILTKDIQPVR